MTLQRIRVVSGLAVNAAGEALMGLRLPNKRRPNMWEYPGGKVDRGEGDETALRREWQEELGIAPTIGKRLARVNFELETPSVLSLYHVILGDLVPAVGDSHQELRWVAPLYAIEWLACTPSTYLVFPLVRAFMNSLGKHTLR